MPFIVTQENEILMYTNFSNIDFPNSMLQLKRERSYDHSYRINLRSFSLTTWINRVKAPNDIAQKNIPFKD